MRKVETNCRDLAAQSPKLKLDDGSLAARLRGSWFGLAASEEL